MQNFVLEAFRSEPTIVEAEKIRWGWRVWVSKGPYLLASFVARTKASRSRKIARCIEEIELSLQHGSDRL